MALLLPLILFALFTAACDNPANGEKPRYGIRLSIEGTDVTGQEITDKGSVTAGYSPITPIPVTVTNTGNRATGALTLALSGTNAASFTLSGASIASIPAGGTGSFSVGPKHGLTEGTYNATVTVSGGNGITAGFSGSFTVNAASNPNVPSTAAAITGFSFEDPPATGVIDGEAKTVAVEVPWGTDVTGLVPTITVSPGAGIDPASGVSQNFTNPVTYTVTAADGTTTADYTVTVSVAANPSVPSAEAAITAFSFESPPVTGVIDGEAKTIAVTVLSGAEVTGLVPIITVSPGAGIDPASGEAQDFTGPVTYTVTAEDETTAADYTVTVTVKESLNSAAEVSSYLSSVSGGFSAAAPVFLPVNITLSGDWASLLAAIQTANRFVALDLSACDISCMTGTTGEFDPGAANTGESRIVSLLLPDTATSVKAGTWSDAAFKYFTALESVSGAGIETVGDYAFRDCRGLKTLNLPAATTIGEYAFAYCTGLTEVSLDAATIIGPWAFAGCTGLETVSLSAATDIRYWAFRGCTGLTEVSLPSATSIDEGAFEGCTSLGSVSLPAGLTSIGANPFAGCTALTDITVASGNPSYKAENGMLLSIDGATLIAYPSAAGRVTLDGITSVGDFAFDDCAGLETASFPLATTIGNVAFFGCTALETLSLPAATDIGDAAFGRCTSLTSVSLPSATTIGWYAFSYCTGLETLSLSAATSIGSGAFEGCTGTKALTVTLGEAAPALGPEMFYDVGARTVTVLVPSGATGYGEVPGTYNETSAPYTANWGNGFRGGGWNGSAMMDSGDSNVNANISLTITELAP